MTDAIHRWIRFLLPALLLLGAALFLQARSRQENVPPRQEIVSFPKQVGAWQGRDLGIGPDVREILGPGEFLSRIYVRKQDERYINFFVAYFPSQRTGATIHSPKNCLPGSGWTPMESTRIQVTAPGKAPITVNRYIIGKGLDRQLVLYWYQAHSRVVASEYWARFYLVADSLRMNRSDGSLVRVITPVAEGESVAGAQQRALEFTQQILPTLDRYIPQ